MVDTNSVRLVCLSVHPFRALHDHVGLAEQQCFAVLAITKKQNKN